MTLFLSTLFFFLFNDFFALNHNFIVVLYFIYVFIYVFYKKSNIIILPSKLLLAGYFLNLKFLFLSSCTCLYTILQLLPHRIKWKPLFKRSSYFGIYRSTRNQWINK